MILCDEDIGTGVPKALSLVGYSSAAMVELSMGGLPDVQWLEIAGKNEWLVVSCNKKMLLVQEERDTIIRENVGIVFLTNGEENLPRVLWLLLVKWRWLQELAATEPKPFARFLSPSGRVSQRYTYRGMPLYI